MARYCGDHIVDPVLEVALDFKNRCLFGGGSIFTESQIWTIENVENLNTHFVQNLDEGEDKFLVKLESQMKNATESAKILMGEMEWLLALCPSNISPKTKRDSILKILSWSSVPRKNNNDYYLSDLVLSGIGSAGTSFNTSRWRELVYCIKLMQALLAVGVQERTELLSAHNSLGQWLANIEGSESRQFRHMLLFLLFPDESERIFSQTSRKEIITSFTNMTMKECNGLKAHEVDRELLNLRQTLVNKYNTNEIDYYTEPLRSDWQKTTGNKTIEIERDTSIEKEISMPDKISPSLNQILYGPPGTGKTYSTVDKALEIIDPAFLNANRENRHELKSRFDDLITDKRISFVTFHQSFSYEDFVEGLKAVTEEGQIKYEVQDGIFKLMCQAASYENQIAGDALDIDITGRAIWKMSLGNTAIAADSDIYQHCIDNSCVLLGYGRTINFSMDSSRLEIEQRIADEENNYKPTSKAIGMIDTFKNIIKTGDLVIISDGNNKFRAIAEITSNYIFDDSLVDTLGYAQKRGVKWLRTYYPSLPIDEIFDRNLSQVTLYRLQEPTINLKRLQSHLSGHQAKARSQVLCSGMKIGRGTIEKTTEEIVSIRKTDGSLLPIPMVIVNQLLKLVDEQKISIDDIEQKNVFKRVDVALDRFLVNGYPGTFSLLVRAIWEHRRTDAEPEISDKRVLIIDEINRGNISNIFGELITLIEPNKRAGKDEALSTKLPYSKEYFSVPSNLYIIGTMNTADKSLTQIDTALRRRFEFIEIMPDYNCLKDIKIQETDINIASLLQAINQRLELIYDREHTIGHSFFLPLKSVPTLAKLKHIFLAHILPLLEEYFYDDWTRIREVLGDHLKQSPDLQFITQKHCQRDISRLMGKQWDMSDTQPYQRNIEALDNPEAYIGIYETTEIY